MNKSFWVIEDCGTSGIHLHRARRLNDEEKMKFTPGYYRLYALVGERGPHHILHYLSADDCPNRAPDGEFVGFGSRAWIISSSEAKKYIELNSKRESQHHE